MMLVLISNVNSNLVFVVVLVLFVTSDITNDGGSYTNPVHRESQPKIIFIIRYWRFFSYWNHGEVPLLPSVDQEEIDNSNPPH